MKRCKLKVRKRIHFWWVYCPNLNVDLIGPIISWQEACEDARKALRWHTPSECAKVVEMVREGKGKMTLLNYERLYDILAIVESEVRTAVELFPPFHSAHEGYAVILEEMDELWEEIKNNKSPESLKRQRKEAKQVAAMAIRFLLDIDLDNYRNEIENHNGE